MKHKKINLLLVVLVISISTIIFFRNYRFEKAEPNPYGIENGEIILKVPYQNSTDLVVKQGDTFIFYSFLQMKDHEEKYENQIAWQAEYYFDFTARSNVEGKTRDTLIDSVEVHLSLLLANYKNSNNFRLIIHIMV